MSSSELNESLISTLNEDENVLFTNCRLLRDGKLVRDDLWVKGGIIIDGQSWFYGVQKSATRVVDCKGHILAPGFIDMQLNGGFGVDFSVPDGGDLAKAVEIVAENVLQYGCTAFCPTIITSSPDTYSKIVPQHKQVPGGRHGASVLGLHLEGPFINPAKKGCHPAEMMHNYGLGPAEQSPDEQEARLAELIPKGTTAVEADKLRQQVVHEAVDAIYPSLDSVALVTLAPEITGAIDAVRYLTSKGIKVSLGHSRSGLASAVDAVVAGATVVTHMFNAMAAFHHRDPGIVGVIADTKVLELDRTLFYGVIVDGFHTHPTSLRMAHATHAKGCVLVTDAMAGMGLPPGEHGLASLRVNISKDRKATVVGKPETLAGSVATMEESVQNFAKVVGVEDALTAATLHPAQALGIDDRKGTLLPGRDADLVLLDDDLEVQATYISGQVCWARSSHAAALFYSPRKSR